MTPTNCTPAQAPELSPYHAAILKCVERYKSFDFEDAKLRTFLDEIEEGCRSSLPIQKLNRWLGYVQGVLISRGLTSVAVERDWTRPLFRPLDFPAPSANAAQVTDADFSDYDAGLTRVKLAAAERALAERAGGGAEAKNLADIAERYRQAMMKAEALINSTPMPVVQDGRTSMLWKRISDAADVLRAARHGVIWGYDHASPAAPSPTAGEAGE